MALEGRAVLIRAGKSLPLTATEVHVDLKRPPLSRLSPDDEQLPALPARADDHDLAGRARQEAGRGAGSVATELVAVRNAERDEVDAYERLLTDAMKGDPTLFVREDAVEEAWRVVDGILDNVAPVRPYEPGTWGPAEADRLVADLKGWHNPSKEA